MRLRKELEKTKSLNLRFAKGSETLDEIIKVQHSLLIKTGLGYTLRTSQPEKSLAITKSYLNGAKPVNNVSILSKSLKELPR